MLEAITLRSVQEIYDIDKFEINVEKLHRRMDIVK
jgi:hypothetical protein